mmetsp:Transcript_2730/g.251  ORF Transcript_2730/g.251 Transcript_2730/m.251 type:complete len:100 (+) Transcript_2730:230-529(+)
MLLRSLSVVLLLLKYLIIGNLLLKLLTIFSHILLNFLLKLCFNLIQIISIFMRNYHRVLKYFFPTNSLVYIYSQHSGNYMGSFQGPVRVDGNRFVINVI